jgi:dienelactone hydrolase
MNKLTIPNAHEQAVQVLAGSAQLEGNLVIPANPHGIVLFAHGSGSSRHSPRNRYVASSLQHAGIATLLMDLLTADEDDIDRRTRQIRFDMNLLSARLVGATDWLLTAPETKGLPIGYFGASTGSAAALIAATKRPEVVKAIVSRGGRPDLAGSALSRVYAPTLLIVGGHDFPCIGMNEDALAWLKHATAKRIDIVPGATHLFTESGTLERVAALACQWFQRYL